MDQTVDDIRIAARSLRRSATFTVSAVLILGLAMGMAVAMWIVFSAVLLRRPPVQDPEHIVLLNSVDRDGTDIGMPIQQVERLRRESRTLRRVSGFAHWGTFASPMIDGDQPIVLNGAQVDGNFFALLGARPVLGRLLQPDDDTASHVIVLSYGAWQRRFGGDLSVIGHRLTQPLGPWTFRIVGVAPPGLDFPVGADYWESPPFFQVQNVIARLAPNASPTSASAEFLSLLQRFDREGPTPVNIRAAAVVRTFTTAVVGNVRPVLVMLTAAIALLLVIACVNVGNLLLLRAATRSREFAIRGALGATYGTIVRQLLIENALLGAAAGGVGLCCAEVCRRVLIAAAPRQLPGVDSIRVSGVPVGTAVGVTLLSVLLFGAMPAFTAVRRNPASPLRIDERSGQGTQEGRKVRQVLVAAQLALALIMLAGAGLLARSAQELAAVKLGYRADHLAVLELSFPVRKYSQHDNLFALAEALARPLRAVPGVTAITPVIVPPFLGPDVWAGQWQADWQSQAEAAASATIPVEVGGAEFFQTLGIPILRGRGFLEADRENAAKVAVISDAVARRYWPGQDPIGKRIRFVGDSEPWRTVVGMAGDARLRTLRAVTPMVYLPWRQFYSQGFIAIRTAATLGAVLPGIRRAIRETDPGVTLWRARTMDDLLAERLAQPRLGALLLSGFGIVALVLAAIGLYGVMASVVREQRREIGIRMALGATPDRLRRDVLRGALAVSAAGAVVGLAGALVASRLVRSLLFQVSPNDPVTLLGACGLLLAVATVAAYVPAWQASAVDPARALQLE